MKAACQPPETSSHWSVRQLAEQPRKQVGISKSQLQKLLREMDLQPHRFEMWLNSQDPDFEAKETAIIGLYLQAPPKCAGAVGRSCLDPDPDFSRLNYEPTSEVGFRLYFFMR